MKKSVIVGGAVAVMACVVLGFAVLATRDRIVEEDAEPSVASAATPVAPATPTPEPHPGFLHGRIVTDTGAVHEGRLRWGGNQEAFWGDYFNGFKPRNPWMAHVPAASMTDTGKSVRIFGFELAREEKEVRVGRPFMARFGDIARIEPSGGDVRVTLKSGTLFELDRLEASDFDDDVRVWDVAGGVIDLNSLRIRSIELLPTPPLVDAPSRLQGTVRTAQGEFTGFIQWDREKGVGSDELDGKTPDGFTRLRFDSMRSIARRAQGPPVVTLLDGREVVFTSSHDLGRESRGVYVDDPRYGRVLISMQAFERADFTQGGSGPGYDEFPPGRSLAGSVTTRDGRRLAGRLVFDLDESETTETLDAPSGGVDYTILFRLIASIIPPSRVILHQGAELQLDPAGDLGDGNAGMLVFAADETSPEHVPWKDVARIDFENARAAAAAD